MARRSRNFLNTFAVSAAAICLVYILLNIVTLLVTLITTRTNIDALDIISLAINICFYCLVALYFYRARNGNGGSAYYAMLCLALATYLIPFIMQIFTGIVTLNFSVMILSISLLAGIIYSIILILESRNHKKAYVITLIILGIILLISGLSSLINTLWVSISLLINNFVNLSIGALASEILLILTTIVNFGFSLIFASFPLLLVK